MEHVRSRFHGCAKPPSPVKTQRMTCLTSGPHGEIAVPANLRKRHGIGADTPIRVIETRNGILLVPLSSEPMSPVLAQELAEWQALASTSWEMFDYQLDAP